MAMNLFSRCWRNAKVRHGTEFAEQPGRTELSRHEQVGGIAIMQENDSKGAALILASRPSLHTVLFPTSEVSGNNRTRGYAVLAGNASYRTEVVEHGHRFVVDLAGAYFSARLLTERQRIFAQVQEHELVLDMFAVCRAVCDHARPCGQRS